MRFINWLAYVAGTISGRFTTPKEPILSSEKWDEIWQATK